MKLTGFLQKLSGEALVVELKNGTVVLGTVIGTDVAMNMHLRVVTLTAKDKNPVKMDALSIRGSNVRYIMCVEGGAGRAGAGAGPVAARGAAVEAPAARSGTGLLTHHTTPRTRTTLPRHPTRFFPAWQSPR